MKKENREILLGVEAKHNRASWSQWRVSNYEYFKDKLFGLDKKLRLLDLGAGNVPFRDLFFVFEYTGVDHVSFPSVTVIADFEKSIPIQDGQSDIITLSNVLEHVSHPLILLNECRRVLTPGGKIIGTVPFLMKAHQLPYDYNRYTSYQIKNMLEEVGFVDIEVIPLGRLVDVYDTFELKFFATALSREASFLKKILLTVVRHIRRLEMRFIRMLVRNIHSCEEYTEGYGFCAIRR